RDPLAALLCFLHALSHDLYLHSFPTRRSSDLFFTESSTSDEMKAAKQQALLRIVKSAYEYLQNHTAPEAVVYAVSLLEDDELFKDRKSTRLNSSHVKISYAVFCLKKKNIVQQA